ncbi:Gypsy retrotransposon integrase-like protein 1 [Marasmius tenuissimus]|uniref:Gypsy retrotransposon integrase-like protein 1 n=1 Tax=Marasmius tenuissimus TaxID=585030 RepID=A0ABR3A3A3_9AGAR
MRTDTLPYDRELVAIYVALDIATESEKVEEKERVVHDSLATLLTGSDNDARVAAVVRGHNERDSSSVLLMTSLSKDTVITNHPNSDFVEYSNTLVELLRSYAQNLHNELILKKLVKHIYKHRCAALKHHARSLLAAFPKGDCPVKLYSSEEKWPPLRKSLSRPLANIVRQLHGKEELHSLAFEEPNFLVLREETLASPLLLIHWVVAAIIQDRNADVSEEGHVHDCCALLKEIIEAVPSRYWYLEAVGDYLYECYTDVYLNTDWNISVESPSELDPAVSIFLKGIASFYKYEAARRALVMHPFCQRTQAPVKLVFVELERQDSIKPSPEALGLLMKSWGLPSAMDKYLPSAESTTYIPHCTAAAMAAYAYSRTDTDAARPSRSPPPESLQRFYSGISGLADWALTIGTSNACCQACSLLRGTLERTFGIEFNIASMGHSEWSPWWAPGWLSDHILRQMQPFLLQLLRDFLERLDPGDSSSSDGDSPVLESPTEEALDINFAAFSIDAPCDPERPPGKENTEETLLILKELANRVAYLEEQSEAHKKRMRGWRSLATDSESSAASGPPRPPINTYFSPAYTPTHVESGIGREEKDNDSSTADLVKAVVNQLAISTGPDASCSQTEDLEQHSRDSESNTVPWSGTSTSGPGTSNDVAVWERTRVRKHAGSSKSEEGWQVMAGTQDPSNSLMYHRYTFPPPDLLPTLISLYFTHVHPIYPVLHKAIFEQSVKEGLQHRDVFFSSALLAVCALGSRYCSDFRVLEDNDGIDGYRGFNNRSNGRSKSRISAGWKWFRQIRLTRLELGTKPSFFDLPLPLECDDEYWIWKMQGEANHGNVGLEFKQPEDKPSKMSYWVTLLKLLDIMGFAHKTLYAVRKNEMWTRSGTTEAEWNERIVSEIDGLLNTWIDNVPAHLKWNPNRYHYPGYDPNEPNPFFNQSTVIYVTYYWAQIFVHKPFLSATLNPVSPPTATTATPGEGQAPEWRFPSAAICTNAARSIISLAEIAYSRECERQGDECRPPLSALINTVISSATILFVNVWRQCRPGVKDRSTSNVLRDLGDVHRCTEILRKWERMSQSSGRCCDILTGLLHTYGLSSSSMGPHLARGMPRARDENDEREQISDANYNSSGEAQHPHLTGMMAAHSHSITGSRRAYNSNLVAPQFSLPGYQGGESSGSVPDYATLHQVHDSGAQHHPLHQPQSRPPPIPQNPQEDQFSLLLGSEELGGLVGSRSHRSFVHDYGLGNNTSEMSRPTHSGMNPHPHQDEIPPWYSGRGYAASASGSSLAANSVQGLDHPDSYMQGLAYSASGEMGPGRFDSYGIQAQAPEGGFPANEHGPASYNGLNLPTVDLDEVLRSQSFGSFFSQLQSQGPS